MTASTERQANRVDTHVGENVRARRRYLGLSQDALAATLGLTFQQVQKYERGTNRISASKLWEISKTLKIPVGQLFEGCDEDGDGQKVFEETPAEQVANAFLLTAEGIDLAQAFPKIRNPKWRRKILELVRSLSEHD